VWLGGALFKGWAAGFIGSVVIGTIVALVSFVAGGDMVVMVEILTGGRGCSGVGCGSERPEKQAVAALWVTCWSFR
jgi:hypothetical protein